MTERKLSPFGLNVWKYRLKNTVTASFDRTVRQMTKTSQQKNDRNVSAKKKKNSLQFAFRRTAYGIGRKPFLTKDTLHWSRHHAREFILNGTILVWLGLISVGRIFFRRAAVVWSYFANSKLREKHFSTKKLFGNISNFKIQGGQGPPLFRRPCLVLNFKIRRPCFAIPHTTSWTQWIWNYFPTPVGKAAVTLTYACKQSPFAEK